MTVQMVGTQVESKAKKQSKEKKKNHCTRTSTIHCTKATTTTAVLKLRLTIMLLLRRCRSIVTAPRIGTTTKINNNNTVIQPSSYQRQQYSAAASASASASSSSVPPRTGIWSTLAVGGGVAVCASVLLSLSTAEAEEEKKNNRNASPSTHTHTHTHIDAYTCSGAVCDDELSTELCILCVCWFSCLPDWVGDRICDAAASGDLTKLQTLFAQHTPIEGVNITHRYGWTPLHVAVANDRQEVVDWLLAQPGIDIDKVDRYGPRARNLDAMVTKHSARSAAFPELWPNQSANGMAALHYAALFASPSVVESLARAGADLDLVEGHGLTADGLIDWSRLDTDPQAETSELKEKRQRMTIINDYLQRARKEREIERARKEKEDRLRFPLELKLKEQMVGQEIPIISVAAALRRRDNGWFDPTKPLVFLFLGSSGVGKTMLAKLIASSVSKDKENGFIRIDMR